MLVGPVKLTKLKAVVNVTAEAGSCPPPLMVALRCGMNSTLPDHPFVGPGTIAATSMAVQTPSLNAVPAEAQANVFNVTVVPPGPLGYLTLWPQGQAQPAVAALNALDASITSNLAIVPATNGATVRFRRYW